MDEEIREALVRGDMDAAFQLLFRAYGPAVYSRCCRILRDLAAAEDMMQEALISAFQSPGQMRDVIHLRSWLLQIATRKCIDRLRSVGRDLRRLEPLDLADAPAPDPDLLSRLATTRERGALEECLAALDSETASAFLMRYQDDLAWEEIARILELPLDTIRMRVNRGALKSLRTCLSSKGIEP